MKADGKGERKNSGKPRVDFLPLSVFRLLYSFTGPSMPVDLLALAEWFYKDKSLLRAYAFKTDSTTPNYTGYFKSLRGVTDVFTKGAEKYAERNWERGMSWSTVYQSAMRHGFKVLAGEEIDEESGLPHIDHYNCNITMLLEYEVTYKEGDDRPCAKKDDE